MDFMSLDETNLWSGIQAINGLLLQQIWLGQQTWII